MTRMRLRLAEIAVPLLTGIALAGPGAGTAAAASVPVVPNLLLNGTVNQPLSGTLPGSDSAGTTFTVTSPSLMPPGIDVTPAGGVTGIPTADGIYGVTVTACGPDGCTPGTITFTIAPDTAPCDNQPNITQPPGSLGTATVTGS
jgi:hypothetical protein